MPPHPVLAGDRSRPSRGERSKCLAAGMPRGHWSSAASPARGRGRRLWPALLLAAWGAARAAAAPLGWDDCVRETASNNPSLAGARAAADQSRAEFQAAYAPFLPQVTASASASKSNTELDTGYTASTTYRASLSANQTLFAGGADLGALRRAELLAQIADLNARSVAAAVSADLRQAFAALLFAQDNLALTERIAARRQDNVRLVSMRFDAGRENKGSLLRSEAFRRQAQFQAAQARRGLAASRRQLAAVLGRPAAGTALSVTGAWESAAPPPAPDFAAAARQTLDARQADARARAAREGLRVARGALFPTWSVNASVGRSDDESFFPDRDQWTVGTLLTYPLFSGGRDRQAVRGAQAAVRASDAALDEARLRAAAALEARFAAWEDAGERTAVQAEFLEAASVRAEIARAQYQNGLLSFEDWDLIENDLIDKQTALLASRRDAVLARAAWDQAMGTAVFP